MSKANPTVNQNGVLDDVRRALGRSSTVPPIPLDPFCPRLFSVTGDKLKFVGQVMHLRTNGGGFFSEVRYQLTYIGLSAWLDEWIE